MEEEARTEVTALDDAMATLASRLEALSEERDALEHRVRALEDELVLVRTRAKLLALGMMRRFFSTSAGDLNQSAKSEVTRKTSS